MPPSTAEITTLRQQYYEQRLRVNQLYRLVYEREQTPATLQAMEQMMAAQATLFDLEAQLTRAEQQAQPQAQAVHLPPVDTAREATTMRDGSAAREAYTPNVTRGLETTGLDVDVRLQMAYVPTAIYHLFVPEQKPLVECIVRTNAASRRRLRVIAYIEGYSAQAVQSLELSNSEAPTIRLLPTLFPDKVRTVRELTCATLNVLAEDLHSKEIEVHKTVPIWLLARNSAPLGVKNPSTDTWEDLTPYYGAFVTPHEESVMRFLREAVDEHVMGQLVGYQGDAPVMAQVEAIYKALQSKANIKYVNSLVDFNPDEAAKTQRVRLPRETLQERQANCIDGALLFASLLEAISLNPALVLIPKHALIGWEIAPGSNRWRYLETTMLGSNHTFDEAVEHGSQQAQIHEARKAQDQVAGKKGDGWFRRWSLQELRTECHITPME